MSAKYGPGTDEVTAFLLHVGTLTPPEVIALSSDLDGHELRHRVRAKARNRSLLAAIDHDLVDEWAAARAQARDHLNVKGADSDTITPEAWRGVRNLVFDVAAALVTRHLIVDTEPRDTEPRDTDFTQEDYDTLTGGWRRTVGSLHPDDHGFPGEDEH